MAEISRVLKPGGIFVASTFLTPFAPLGEIIGDSTIRPISQVRPHCLLSWCVYVCHLVEGGRSGGRGRTGAALQREMCVLWFVVGNL